MKHLIISGGKYKNHHIIYPPGKLRPAMNVMREALFQILEGLMIGGGENSVVVDRSVGAQSTTTGTEHLVNSVTTLPNLPNPTTRNFLDLFSGSGLMAIEAVSRHYDNAVAVELDKLKWNTIKKNFSINPAKLRLIQDGVEKFLLRNTKPFAVIYADPPFDYKYKDDLMHKIISSKSIRHNSIVIIHMSKKETLEDSYTYQNKTLTRFDTRNYGGSFLHFFRAVMG